VDTRKLLFNEGVYFSSRGSYWPSDVSSLIICRFFHQLFGRDGQVCAKSWAMSQTLCVCRIRTPSSKPKHVEVLGRQRTCQRPDCTWSIVADIANSMMPNPV